MLSFLLAPSTSFPLILAVAIVKPIDGFLLLVKKKFRVLHSHRLKCFTVRPVQHSLVGTIINDIALSTFQYSTQLCVFSHSSHQATPFRDQKFVSFANCPVSHLFPLSFIPLDKDGVPLAS